MYKIGGQIYFKTNMRVSHEVLFMKEKRLHKEDKGNH